MDNNQTLIASIEAFDIDGGPVQTSFADRLAEEQGWTPEFTQRVIREYKRFVALAMISKTPVTPSLIVDEAWHLHLIYTRSYWERFMPLLPRPLHHEPTKGGESEDSKHKNQFNATLELYRQTFGEEAPADIWRANPRAATIEPRSKPRSNWLGWSLAGASAAMLAGCTTVGQLDSGVPMLVPFILIFGGFIAFIAIVSLVSGRNRNRPHNGQCSTTSGGGCSSTTTDSGTSGHNHGGHCSAGGHCSGGHGGDSGSGGDGGGGDGGGSCGGGGCGGGGCGG